MMYKLLPNDFKEVAEMKHMKKTKVILFDMITVLIPLTVFIGYLYFLNRYSAYIINSDMASDLVLAKHLADTNQILSSDWYYSTDLRVLHTNIVFAPLFKMFSSYHMVRMVGNGILMASLFWSAFYFSRMLGLDWHMGCIVGTLMLIPFWGNNNYYGSYFYAVMAIGGYIPHIFISFLTFGILLWIGKNRNRTKRMAGNTFVTILSFITGCGGVRQLLVLYFPVVIGAVLNRAYLRKQENNINVYDECRNYLLSGILALAGGIAGCGFNALYLTRKYSFYDYSTVQFSEFDIGRVVSAINGFISGYGYQAGGSLFSIDCIRNVLAAAIMIAIVVSCGLCLKAKTPGWCFLVFTFISAVTIFAMLYGFSTMKYEARHAIPIYVLGFPLLAKQVGDMLKGKRCAKLAIIIRVALLLLFSVVDYQQITTGTYNIVDEDDNNVEKREIVARILDNECYYGYATFWNANSLTELSDGLIEMHAWGADISELQDFNYVYEWLQLKSHTEIPQGKVFCMFSAAQWDSPLALRMKEENLVYSSELYRAYVYDSYEEMAGTGLN